MDPRKLPIGIQDFEKLRQMGYVYVDKTAYVYRLANEANPYFLSRPRRFGKSLLLSTFKAYFLGKRELFQETGDRSRLAIANLEREWVEHPVFHIDLNVEKYDSPAALESAFGTNLRPLEEKWGRAPEETTGPARFMGLIRRAFEKTGKKVAVLVDEYDKPLLETMDNPELNEELRKGLKAFYGVLKTADPWLRFAFLTGVTKFSQVTVFSDLNQLRDISLDRDYAAVCGITEAELAGNFENEIRILGQFAAAEERSAAGRADAVVTTKDTVYVFEFKLAGNGTVDEALRQIDDKGYLIPWTAGGKKLVKVGAVFDPAARTLGEWKVINL